MLDLLGSEELTVNGRQRQLDGDGLVQQGIRNRNIVRSDTVSILRYGDGGNGGGGKGQRLVFRGQVRTGDFDLDLDFDFDLICTIGSAANQV